MGPRGWPHAERSIGGALFLSLCGLAMACDGAPERSRAAPARSPEEAPATPRMPPPPVAPAAPPEAPPEPEPRLPADPTTACERHADCRVLRGVCGNPEACNAASVDEVQERIDRRARVASCGPPVYDPEDTTPACVARVCTAVLGPVEEHRCDDDADCAVASGICGPTEAVRRDALDAFDARIAALRRRGIRCGPGAPPAAARAACDDGLCLAGRER